MGSKKRITMIILFSLLMLGTFITFKIIDKLSGYNVDSFSLKKLLSDKIDEAIASKKTEFKATLKSGALSGLGGESSAESSSGVSFGGVAGGGIGVGAAGSTAVLADAVEKSGGNISRLPPAARSKVSAYSRMSNSELREVYNSLSPSQKAKLKRNKDKIKRALGR